MLKEQERILLSRAFSYSYTLDKVSDKPKTEILNFIFRKFRNFIFRNFEFYIPEICASREARRDGMILPCLYM